MTTKLHKIKIAILGAGVAGINSAIALAQKGFDVTVYERDKSVSSIGAGIIVWPNAAYVLESLGVLNDIKAASGYPSKMQRLSSHGEDLGTIDIDLLNQHMGYPSLSVLRSDFQNIITDKLKSSGVEIQYAHTVTDIKKKNSGRAEVHFQNGLNISPDIIIGADGRMASCARQYVQGSNTPAYQGFINWIGVYQSENSAFDEIAVSDYWGTGERFGIVPVTRHKAYWAGGIASPEIGQRNPSDYKDELASVFSDWPQPVQKMIGHTPVDRINKIYVHDHDTVPTWHRDNLVMIGDAAHAPLPTSGQGACQALEDAWHLANCLVEFPLDHEQAFSRFTRLRLEKTSGIILAARNFASSLFNRDDAYCQSRNENSRNTDFKAVAVAMANGWGQHLPLGA